MASHLIRVRVQPRARAALLTREPDGSWSAHVKPPAEDGRANRELIALLAQHFCCPHSAVSIKSGLASRNKWVRITAAGFDGDSAA